MAPQRWLHNLDHGYEGKNLLKRRLQFPGNDVSPLDMLEEGMCLHKNKITAMKSFNYYNSKYPVPVYAQKGESVRNQS
jgi:hypothetical protein